MKIYRPNRFIWAVTFLFLATATVLAARVVVHSAGSDLLGASLLLLIFLLSTLAVGYSRSMRIELTSTYVAQQGLRSWRLAWRDFDRIVVRGDSEGDIIELIDRQGKVYTPAVLLFASRQDKETFIASVRQHSAKTPNQSPEPTAGLAPGRGSA